MPVNILIKPKDTKGGLTTWRSWQELIPLLEKSIRLESCEVLTDLEIAEDGIKFILEYTKESNP